MRLFIAIDLPPHVRRAAADMAAQLRAYGARGRFVPPENYHVTLRFIGESDALSDAVDAMRSAVRDGRPFLLRLGGYGAFPGRAGRTGFVRVTGDLPELGRLHETLESALCERGFGRGRGRLEPHVTLGRSITGDDGFAAVPDAAFAAGEAFPVQEITLFESRRERGGMVYLPLHREPVG